MLSILVPIDLAVSAADHWAALADVAAAGEDEAATFLLVFESWAGSLFTERQGS